MLGSGAGSARCSAAILGTIVAAAGAAEVPTFTGITLPFGVDGRVGSVGGVSADGSVVVGGSFAATGTRQTYALFRWRLGAGFDAPIPPEPDTLAEATGVSADGSVVVGYATSSRATDAWIVSRAGVVRLTGRRLAGVSADGSLCVGWSTGESAPDRAGVYCISSGAWSDLSSPLPWSRALCASSDGSVVVGEAGPSEGVVSQAFRAAGSRCVRLPARADALAAFTVHTDGSGSLVAASSLEPADDPLEGAVLGRTAWLWTAAQGAVDVAADFEVRALSPDGHVLVGRSVDDENVMPERAMIWDSVRGSRELRAALEQVGLASDIAGWTLLSADAVSQTGRTYAVAGTGLDRQGFSAGWVATFEMPPAAARAGADDIPIQGVSTEPPAAMHVDQELLRALVRAGKTETARQLAFDIGDRLFNTTLNEADGVGANVGDGQRFTRVPRADLAAPGQWATHIPSRPTGPNASSCNACHAQPFDDGAGRVEQNVVSDPLHTGRPDSMIQRNTPHLFGAGAVQRLAEEMTADLRRTADQARDAARTSGAPASRPLLAKGVAFGTITALPPADGRAPPALDTSRVEGVDEDLVVRPFQWKGAEASLRQFVREAAHREIGMQAVELVGAGVDGDGDGTIDELSVGDITALTVYVAGQPRPTTRSELAALRLIAPVPGTELSAIKRGRDRFAAVGCAVCHVPSLTLGDPVFFEPSRSAPYRDKVFPSGMDPSRLGLTAPEAIAFDLTGDQPDNVVTDPSTRLPYPLAPFARNQRGSAVIELYGDLKRHDMGPGLADSIDETGCGKSVFLTRNLWGVGSTAPYLHDGRATTLAEAILAHGGEAADSRDAFRALPEHDRNDLLTFLKSLVLYKDK